MNGNHFVGIENSNLGNAANNFINAPDTPGFNTDDKFIDKNNCRNFLKTLCTQLKNRFNNFQNNYYDVLPCLDLINALSPGYHQDNPSALLTFYSNSEDFTANENERNRIVDSWKELILIEDLNIDLRDPGIEISKFYFGLYDYVNPVGENSLRELATFVLNILIVPHSNVEPERIWSKEELTKTNIRNKLHLSTFYALFQVSQHIQNSRNCTTFEPNEMMLQLFALADTNNQFDVME